MYNYYKVITKEGKHFKIVFLEDTHCYGTRFFKGSWIKVRRIKSFNERCSLYEFKTNETRNFYHYRKTKKIRFVVEEDYINSIFVKGFDLYNSSLLKKLIEKKDNLSYKKNVVTESFSASSYSSSSSFFINDDNEFIVPNVDIKFWDPLITSVGKDYYILENRIYENDIYLIDKNMMLKKDITLSYSQNKFTKGNKSYLISTEFININYEFELLKDDRTVVCKVFKNGELAKTLEAKLSRKLKDSFCYKFFFKYAEINQESFINLKGKNVNKMFYLNEKKNIFNYVGSYKTSALKINTFNTGTRTKDYYFGNSHNNCITTKSHLLYKGKEYLNLPSNLIVSRHKKCEDSKKILKKFSIRFRPKDYIVLFNDKEYSSVILKEFDIIKKCKSIKAICDCEDAKLVICYSFDKNYSIYETIDLLTKKVICLSETNFLFIERGPDEDFLNKFYSNHDINKETNLKKELIKIKLSGGITNE